MAGLIATNAEDPTPDERFREYLASQGMRLTRERAIIVVDVFASQEGFSADQLCARLSRRTDGIRVSRSSVYRTISELIKAGLLVHVQRPGETDYYEYYKPI